jgi:hypothetical protein
MVSCFLDTTEACRLSAPKVSTATIRTVSHPTNKHQNQTKNETKAEETNLAAIQDELKKRNEKKKKNTQQTQTMQ